MKTSSRFSPNENTSTITFEVKPGLIRKVSSLLLLTRPVDMLMCPLQMFPPMVSRVSDSPGFSIAGNVTVVLGIPENTSKFQKI
ncbi:hypothetical protein TNCV_1927471 [Trichonephila clavipes]|nr:hypothetical protein TNCV_1927471 [Trichonephila clavipes]